MSEIDKIKRYIERTVIPWKLSARYGFELHELDAIVIESRHSMEALMLAFDYGQAKGYRAARAERRKAAAT